ncbi:MAG: complex I NDUFA9 subunit family protein [Chloroflexota bacterium]
MTTVLVTGASGYVGNNVVPKLVERGYNVKAQYRNTERAMMRLGELAEKIEMVTGDVRNRDEMDALMPGVDVVIHLVAIAIEKGDATYEEVNFQGTVNVVDAAKKAGVTRFINMSQNGADSSLPYRFLASKGKAQEYVAASGLDWTALRPSAIFGPQDEFFNTFARLLQLSPIIYPLIGGGTAKFQPVSVFDVAEATVRCVDDDSTIGKELVLGGPEVLTLGEIEERVIAAMDQNRIMVPVPVPVLRPAVSVMQRVLPGSPVTTSLLDLLAVDNTVEDNALVTHFGMDPIPFEGEHAEYLKQADIGETLNQFFTGNPPR